MPTDLITTAFKAQNANANAMWSKIENVTVDYGRGLPVNVTQCILQFSIPEDMGPPVLFFYRLTDFHQNHRRYVASFNQKQLKGDAVGKGEIDGSSCDPLRSDNVTGLPYYPCGLIANSIFNDTFDSPELLGGSEPIRYEMANNTGIAWDSDKELYGQTKYKPNEVSPPPNWRRLYPNYTEELPPPNLAEWEGFMVWMRTAGLPAFSKLYQRNDTTALAQGTYRVVINDGMW